MNDACMNKKNQGQIFKFDSIKNTFFTTGNFLFSYSPNFGLALRVLCATRIGFKVCNRCNVLMFAIPIHCTRQFFYIDHFTVFDFQQNMKSNHHYPFVVICIDDNRL